MSALLSKTLRVNPIDIDDGAGVWLIGKDGTRYLDTCGGVAVSALGHKHPRIIAAAETAAKELSWVHAGTFTTEKVAELAERLVAESGHLSKVYFMSGGSEIMEVAMKLALQHHTERGEASRTTFIARRQSYHGSTLATLALSGNTIRRSCFEPVLNTPVRFVTPCYEYRDRYRYETTAQYVTRLADELDKLIIGLDSNTVAAFVAETVVGSTSGAVPPAPGYFRAIQKICRKHGILFILDEVMCGLGRTGRYFAFHDDDVTPDIVTVGKGLGAGYAPISALLTTDEVLAPILNGSGIIQNGQTHVNNPHAAAVALAVQQTILDEGVLEQSQSAAAHLRNQLETLACEIPLIGDIRGRGMFLGVEFVEPDDGFTPISKPTQFASLLKEAGLQNGALLYPGHGTVDGSQGAHLLVAPPLNSTLTEIGSMVERIHASMSQAVQDWRNLH